MYLAELQFEDQYVLGGMIPGVPGILIGRNKNLTWGVTNNLVDTTDLYLEYQFKKLLCQFFRW